MSDKNNKDKEYEIIKADEEKDVKKFDFGAFGNSNKGIKKQTKNKPFKKTNISKVNKKTKKDTKSAKKNNAGKIINEKVWEEIKKSDVQHYKGLSEKEKDSFIQNVFGNDKKRSFICSSCGSEIQNTYYRFIDKNGENDIYICGICHYNIKYCKNCGMPVLSNNQFQTLCNYCKPSGVCDCCDDKYSNKELNNIYGVKGVFCDNCLKTAKKCSSCGKPISNGNELPNGFILCDYCESISITDKTEIVNTYKSSLGVINRRLGIKGGLNCVPKVSDAVSKIKYDINKEIVYMLIPAGVRKNDLISFVAFEYGKIIAVKLNSKLKNSQLKTDFALWIKYFVLRTFDFNEEFELIKEDMQKKSRFFKWLTSVERSKGEKIVIDRIKKDSFKY